MIQFHADSLAAPCKWEFLSLLMPSMVENIKMTSLFQGEVEHRLYFKSTNDTPCLRLVGELWDIYCIIEYVWVFLNDCTTGTQCIPQAFLVNSSDARDGIFRLIWSITCLLMPWLIRHRQEWYWQYSISNMLHCFIVNLVVFWWTKSKLW